MGEIIAGALPPRKRSGGVHAIEVALTTDKARPAAMFDTRRIIHPDPASPPVLVVTVDTEAEFDWAAPQSRSQRGVGSVTQQHRAQTILLKYGIVPTYLVDSAVVEDDSAVDALRDFLADGAASIGTHLNPWLAPPFSEDLSPLNSFAGNLDPDLERAKLNGLTSRIAERFEVQSRVYRAGRFGLGRHTPAILRSLGYQIDMSIAPYSDYTGDAGPDFSMLGPDPFWIGVAGHLLEVPVTWAYCGALAAQGRRLFRLANSAPGSALRFPGILARLGLVEFVRLTPEGESFAALRALTGTLMRRGARVFSLSYHSPSLAPGNTPYVRNEADLDRLLGTLEQYVDYFLGELGGVAMTPLELRRSLVEQAQQSDTVPQP